MKVFSKKKYIEIESLYREEDNGWLDECDGEEVVNGYIGKYRIDDVWVVDSGCAYCRGERHLNLSVNIVVPDDIATCEELAIASNSVLGGNTNVSTYVVVPISQTGFNYCPVCGRKLGVTT